MIVGYARVSSKSQSLKIQIEQLKRYADENGCDIILFTECASATTIDEIKRPKLHKALALAAQYDTQLVVTYLDRISRNEKDGMAVWNTVDVISLFDIISTEEDARTLFRRAERDNAYRSLKTKNALALIKENLKADCIERYGDVFESYGQEYYVVEYVTEEMYNPKRHLRVCSWDFDDIYPCIMTAWIEHLCCGVDCTIEEATEVAETAIFYLSHKRMIEEAKDLCCYLDNLPQLR